MNELYKVLILLVFFGLGIPCASAANTISFDPQTVEMDMDSSQNVQIVMDEVPDGMSGFNITVSVLDPEVAEITAVSSPDWNSITLDSTSPVPSSSVWISSVDINKKVNSGDTNVPLGNITITGKKAGISDLKILEGSYYNPDGSDYTSNTYPDAILGKINVLDKSDKELPVINSVKLNDNTPNTGDSIRVTVNTTDNVGVSRVKANAVSLVQSGNIWSGSITAVEGTHSVNVSSADEADNVAWDNDTFYTATTPDPTDKELPVINSVELNDNTPKTGDSIHVTVDTTDNVGVSSVKANAVSLVQSGNIWSGSITAVEGTHSVNVSSADEADNVAWDNDTSYTATTPDPTDNSEGELQLWTFDASKVSAVPDNVYTASKDIPYKSNVSLTYNSELGSIDSTCLHGDSGETYFTGAYPTVNENLTFTMGVDSSSPWSYGYLRTSVAYVGVRHASDGSYEIESYWTSDKGNLLNSSFQIPATSVVNNRVTVSIHSYDSNRTNVITAGPGLYVTTPYRTETTRKLPYTNVIQPLIFLDCYASGTDGWVNVHLYNITQSIPRNIITPYARNDIMGFGLDYPNTTNNQKGTDLLISQGQTATVYLSGTNLDRSEDVAYDKSLFANGFEEGIHFYPGLATESLEQAQTTIDTQMEAAETTFGSTPASWSSSENKDNVTHAIYAYNKYGALYRNGMMGTGYISNIDTLTNATWAWWSEGSEHGAVCPCFTHQTDNSPAIPYSIDPDLFKTFVTNLNSKGINLVSFSKWYYSSMAQTATTNILQSDANTMKFQLNTSGGYPVNMNVQTVISPSKLDCNGVSIPFKQTSDGIQFTSVGNGTYTINVQRPVIWEFSPQEPVCGDTLHINGSASPEEKANVSVAFNKTVPVSEGKFEYALENVIIPEGLKNLFTVEARGVNNLNVKAKNVLWLTKSAKASEGTAIVSQSNVPAGTYSVKIDGDAGEKVSEVNLKIMASQDIQADSNGNFSYSYNTTAVPPGNFEVKVGNVAKEITLRPNEKPFPGYSDSPTDLNHDGLYEDINGNRIVDFNDVVAYYDNMNWIGENSNATLFDYNKNNLIDFDDVVKLYGIMP